jgi:hypothetical protein
MRGMIALRAGKDKGANQAGNMRLAKGRPLMLGEPARVKRWGKEKLQ